MNYDTNYSLKTIIIMGFFIGIYICIATGFGYAEFDTVLCKKGILKKEAILNGFVAGVFMPFLIGVKLWEQLFQE